jgi:hypothetical protein
MATAAIRQSFSPPLPCPPQLLPPFLWWLRRRVAFDGHGTGKADLREMELAVAPASVAVDF